MLEHSDQSYDEKKYISGEPPDFKRTMWTDVKHVTFRLYKNNISYLNVFIIWVLILNSWILENFYEVYLNLSISASG